MELPELEERLVPFARTKYGDPFARVSDVYKMPGHAGFSLAHTDEDFAEALTVFDDVAREIAAGNT